jgi:hypothetical protein
MAPPYPPPVQDKNTVRTGFAQALVRQEAVLFRTINGTHNGTVTDANTAFKFTINAIVQFADL